MVSSCWALAPLVLLGLASVALASQSDRPAVGGAPVGESPLHRVYSSLAQSARAPKVGRVSQYYKHERTRVVRIVLTGGPCAGKSSSLHHFTEAAKREGFDVYTAPEAATLIFNCGMSFPQSEEKILEFQKALFKLQLQMERSMTHMAATTGRPSIIIFDRGLMDGRAYMTPKMWSQLLDDVAREGRDAVTVEDGVSEPSILQRYDGVVHMVTAADGAAPFYKHGDVQDDAGNWVHRRETPEEAVELDHRTRSCWEQHPRHVVVHNPQAEQHGRLDPVDPVFEEKLAVATEAVLRIARQAGGRRTRSSRNPPQADERRVSVVLIKK